MVKTASLFSQLLHHFPRNDFQRLVIKHNAEAHAKGFDCWTQFVAMMFCHLAHADSLRQICLGLKNCLGKLIHLGIRTAPNKSTLSYANLKRPAALFEDLFYETLAHFRSHGGMGHRKSTFRFKNKLLSFDSSTISLCLSLFPWASYRRAKGGVKIHVLLDHDDYMPSFLLLTIARKHDVTVAHSLHLNRGSIIVMDRAYNDYKLFAKWLAQGIFFVTRQKSNATYEVIASFPVPRNRNILSDELILLTGTKAQKWYPGELRRIVVWDADNEREIVLLTNHLTFGPTTIAAIYKDRWEIELFFKTLKQNLKVKTFVGTSENALRIQIWTALIGVLVLKWLHYLSRAGWSFSNLVALLRMNLFTYRDLMDWLNDPGTNEPLIPPFQQLTLDIPGFGQQGCLSKPTST